MTRPSLPSSSVSAPPRIRTAEFRGSDFERGRQQGEAFGELVRQSGLIEFYNTYIEKQLSQPPPFGARAGIAFVHRLIAFRQSPWVRRTVAGFAAGSGLPRRAVSLGLAMPDAINFLIGLSGRVAHAAGLGCTSVAAWGEYTVDGRFLYGRDLDFPGNGVWDRFPTLVRHRPDGGIPYVSIACAGSIIDGITGINEEGLTVALHQHIHRESGLWGSRPILDLAHRILNTARDIEEAVALAVRWRTTSAWSVVLTNWKARQACVVERTHDSVAIVRASAGKFVRTNTYADPRLKAGEIDYPAFRESSRLRALRADRLLERSRGRVDETVVASLLADHVDHERDRARCFGETIAQPNNVTSVVLDPERGCAWLAEGPAPVCDSSYRRVPLWGGPPGEETLPLVPPLSHAQRRAYDGYLGAAAEWPDKRDAASARAAMKEAVRQDPREPIFRYFEGLFALMEGDARSAAESLEQGAELPDAPHRIRSQTLWRARALDLAGERSRALELYRPLESDLEAHPAVSRAARRGLERPYEQAETSRILPDWAFGGTFRY